MPQLQKLYILDVTPKQFIDACDETVLQETELLIAKRKQDDLKVYNAQEAKAKLFSSPVFDPELVGPETGHNGDMKRCSLCGNYKKI